MQPISFRSIGNAVAGDKAGFGFNADLGVLLQGSPRKTFVSAMK